MNLRMISKIGATGLALLPLLGSTCVEDKIVDLILTMAAEATFQGRGSVNTHQDTDTVDLKAEVDLDQLLADNDIDPADLDANAIKVSKIFYRVVKAQAGRSVANGNLTVQRQGAPAPAILVTGFAASMAATTDWIDITPLLGAAGVNMLNQFLAECVADVKGGPPVTNSAFTYTVSGDSEPQGVESDFDWGVKVQFQGTVPKTFSLPNF